MCKALSTECQHRVRLRFVLTLALGDEEAVGVGKGCARDQHPRAGGQKLGKEGGSHLFFSPLTFLSLYKLTGFLGLQVLDISTFLL